jgi:transposase
MDGIRFLCVSLGSSTVQLHDSLDSRQACSCSEAGFNSQNGNCAWGLYYRKAASYCALCGQKDSLQRIFIKKMFPVYNRKCLSRKAVQNWVDKFSQGCAKVADDARRGLPVEIATDATVQRVEELVRADGRITIESVARALGCSHGLAYSIMHDLLKFWKVWSYWLPREQ